MLLRGAERSRPPEGELPAGFEVLRSLEWEEPPATRRTPLPVLSIQGVRVHEVLPTPARDGRNHQLHPIRDDPARFQD